MNDLTTADVARELKLHTLTVSRMLLEGRLDGYRVGNRWRVTREALEAYKAQAKNKGAWHRGPSSPENGERKLVEEKARPDLLDFIGLGKELWKKELDGLDAQHYLNKQRTEEWGSE